MPSVIRYLIPGIVSACVITQTPILAQPARPADPPLRNWKTAPYWTPAAAETARTGGLRPLDSTANSNATPLAYVAITPCRLLDTRAASGMTGAFGPPSLAADSSQRGEVARKIPVPSSACGVPAAAAYSLNFALIAPQGASVGWLSAWPDDKRGQGRWS